MAKNRNNTKEVQQRADAKRAGRTRNFATVVYPESAPADWREKLIDLHVAALISPLHDKDVNPGGDLKKAHYHVLLIFDSPQNFETQVKPIFELIGAVGRENVASLRGYARYLCHLDNPEKHQYNPSEVTQYGGADYMSITQLPTDDIKMLMDVFAYIREQEIYSLAELLDLVSVFKPEWFSMISMSRGYIVDKYIKSLEWERSSGYVRAADRAKADPDTGEVIE